MKQRQTVKAVVAAHLPHHFDFSTERDAVPAKHTHAYSLTELTGGCCFLKHWKVKRVWSRVGTAVEAFTQCYGDLRKGHASFLLPASELPSCGTGPTSTLKGTRLIPAA